MSKSIRLLVHKKVEELQPNHNLQFRSFIDDMIYIRFEYNILSGMANCYKLGNIFTVIRSDLLENK